MGLTGLGDELHRCRVMKRRGRWLVSCPDCRETQYATNFHLAMGAAQWHFEEERSPGRAFQVRLVSGERGGWL